MKKPGQPLLVKLSGMFSRLFNNRERPSQAPQQVDTNMVVVVSNPSESPVTRFRRPVPKDILSTPLQHPSSHVSIPPADQPPHATLKLVHTTTARKPIFSPAKTLPAFWTIASLISLVVNVILVVVLSLLGREFFALKALLGDKLLGGLYENFIYMDQAHIKTSITVADSIPINFSLPISQNTVVVLTQNTPINGANVRISTGGLTINSPANIILPAGTNLPVHLELNVPVTTLVPIKIVVPVDIPLQQTELHQPFIGLQRVVAPFYNLMQPQIKTPQDLPLCEPYSAWCAAYFK